MINNTHTLNENDTNIWLQYISNLENNANIAVKSSAELIDLPIRLDLHGKPLHDAQSMLREFVEQHYQAKTNNVVIVVGQTGRVAKDFRKWCRQIPQIRYYDPIVSRNGRSSSYKLYLKSMKY